ncbi:MAG: MMPL family transporter [Kineosporiaceae bacterium]|nr:MMPL family transporter [Kineosporiaceae bacterium]
MLHWLGGHLHRYAKWVAATWFLVIVLAFAAAGGALGFTGLFERLEAGDAPTVPGESRDGGDLLGRADPAQTSVLLLAEGLDLADPRLATTLEPARTRLDALPGVGLVTDPYFPPTTPSAFVSTDRTAIIVSVVLEAGLDGSAREASTDAVHAQLTALGTQLSGLGADRVTVGGVDQLVDEVNAQVQEDLRVGEAIALPISLLVMVIVFGGLLAAGLPIIGAIASIGGALATLLLFSLVIELEASVPSVVSVLGLGLCIDYGLLLVSRFREEVRRLHLEAPGERRRRPDQAVLRDALQHTLGTAGRTVLYSGVTVAISLSGLLFFHSTILRAVGAAGVSVVVLAVVVALTMVPALLALAGTRIVRPGITHWIPGLNRLARRLGDVAPEQGAFSRLATWVQRRPLTVFAGCLVALAGAAWPVLSIEMVTTGTSILPTSSDQRHLFDTMETSFPALNPAPIRVVGKDAQALTALAARVAPLEGVASVEPVQQIGEGDTAVSVFGVRTESDPRLGEAREVVDRIREVRGDVPGIYVTGESAVVRDFMNDIRSRAPWAIGVVALTTVVLLFLMTGSILIPVKALLMNTVSLGASFGVLVWVFQRGNLEGLLDFTSTGGIDQTVPALALAFAFGLSMDYEVFLLSRIKEARDALAAKGSENLNDDAVRQGLQHSGRIITSAALIVVIVFAGFVAGKLLLIKQIGVALAVAVAVDATIVRMLLVPATMTLLGEWNWWAPAPLRRLHERFGLREG